MSDSGSVHRSLQVVQLVLVVALVIAFFLVPPGASKLVVWVCLIIFYVTFWAAIRQPQRMGDGPPTFATFEVLFFVFYYVLFYYPYQLYAVGRFDLTHSSFVFNTYSDQTNKALLCATIGLVAFSLGIGMISKHDKRGIQRTTYPRSKGDPYRRLDVAVLFSLTSFLGVYLATGLRSSGEGKYSDLVSGGVVANGIALVVTVLSMVALATMVVQLKGRKPVSLACWLATALASYWALRILLLGDRNDFLLIAVVPIAGLLTFRVRAGRLVLTTLMIFALLLYNAVQVERSSASHSLSALWSAFVEPEPTLPVNRNQPGNDNSFDITTIGLRATFVAVPAQYPYGHGRYQLIGLAGAVPFVRGVFLHNDTGFVSTSQLLTVVVVGENSGHGVGTNVLSDLYIDFGIWGVPVGMFIAGLLAGLIRRRTLRLPDSTSTAVLYLVTLSFYAEMPRYNVAFPVQPLALVVLLLWTTRTLTKGPSTPSTMASTNEDSRIKLTNAGR